MEIILLEAIRQINLNSLINIIMLVTSNADAMHHAKYDDDDGGSGGDGGVDDDDVDVCRSSSIFKYHCILCIYDAFQHVYGIMELMACSWAIMIN